MPDFLRKKVVVPVDVSEESLGALDTAVRLVGGDPCLVHVVHVLPILEPTEPGMVWEPVDEQERCHHAQEALQKAVAERGFEGVEVTIRLGDPGHEIVYFAEDIDAGLIVIPSHGRGALRRLLLGSVTDRVVHLAPCPVLVMKAREDE